MITAGTIDTSFNIGGGFNDIVFKTIIQPDGKIIVGGNFTDYNGTQTYYIARLNSDGSIDSSFNTGPYLDNRVKSVDLLPDGRILVGGQFTSFNGNNSNYFIVLNSDGTINKQFVNGFDDWVLTTKVQSDGKILVGGLFNNFDGNSSSGIVRLNSDFTIDTSFNVGIGFNNDNVYSIVILSDGNILVGGQFSQYNGINCNNIVLLSPTGSIVNTFGTGFNGRVQKITVQNDGKFLIGGHFNDYNGTTTGYMIRLTSTFLIDSTFIFSYHIFDMYEQVDGRIIVVGKFTQYDGYDVDYIARLNPSGTIDGSFYVPNPINFDDWKNWVNLLPNGSILVGGQFNNYDGQNYNRLIALNNDELTYQYQYVYSATTCEQQSFAPILVTNRPIYYVGSDIELTPGQILSVQDLHSPSKKQCVEILSVTNIAAEPTHSYVSTYDNCLDCFSANTLIALVQSCNPDPELESQFPLIVSNLYQIGDILSIPELHFFNGESENIVYFNDCFTIIDIIPFEESVFFLALPNIVEYSPSKSCEECTSCLGRYYAYSDCENPDENGIIYSHQNLVPGTTILFQSGTTSCKFIDYTSSIIPFFTLNDFTSIFSGSPVVNSTVVYSSCTECLGSWTEEIQGNGYVNFNNPVLAPFDNWGIIGPDNNSCDPGWTYVKYQFTESGSITLDYLFDYQDIEPDYDWAFYYVSPNEPTGNTNIDFNENKFATDDSGGVITINYNAGDWVSIGVFSVDCTSGPGILFISAPQIQENPPYTLHEFTTCNGEQGYVNIPSSQDSQLVDVTQIPYVIINTEELNQMDGPNYPSPNDPPNYYDDDFIEIPFPEGFSTNFLCNSYNSTFMSTNGYVTFGGGSDEWNVNIPSEIPIDTGLPGVYLSTKGDNCVFYWYSGLTNGGNNFVVRFEGTYLSYSEDPNYPPLTYSFIFYKNNPNYFDLVIESNTIFWNGNPTGGVSNGINTSFLGTFNSGSLRAYRITTICPVIKANYGTTPAVCGTLGQSVIGITQSLGSGSMYFDGNTESQTRVVVTNDGDFQFGPGNDLTIEWFQYWTGANANARPFSIGTYGNNTIYLQVSFESNGYLWIGNGTGLYMNYPLNIDLNTITNTWVHFAITRFYSDIFLNRTWRVFLNGIMILEVVEGMFGMSNTTLPLIIGGQTDTDGLFQGYITNFRVNNQTALYTSNFTVPTCPLTAGQNTILLLLASDSGTLLTDSSPVGQTVNSDGNVVWSSESPCGVGAAISGDLYYSNVDEVYSSCEDCGQLYGVTLRECTTGQVYYLSMTLENIAKVLNQGPIFANGGTECYELLDSCIIPNTNEYIPTLFYSNCFLCNQPLSAGTETLVCESCDAAQTVFQVTPPHPTWTNERGKAVVILDAIALGGMFGLNS